MKTLKRERFGRRGDGCLLKRSGSPNWFSSLYVGGKDIVESTKTADLVIAKKVHKQRLREKSADEQGLKPFTTPATKRTRVGALLDDLLLHYETHRPKSIRTIRCHLEHVRTFFGNRRAVSLTTSDGNAFVKRQRQDGASDASIVLRLAYLAVALRREEMNVPAFERPSLNNARQGFFERSEVEAVIHHLPEHLRDVVRFAHATGWRKTECLSLRWSDIVGGEIRLRAEHSKNKMPRVVPLAGSLVEIVERRRGARALCPLVFHRHGRPIGGDFRRSWETGCKAAGLSGRLFHDLRRTAIRDMVRAGVPEVVAMKISGHKTRSVFEDRKSVV
jgi:integrase